MAPKVHEFAVILERDGKQTPWGIRLVGGSDLDTPLIITKVQLGSPAHGELMRGDIVTKIGDYDARDLTHLDAQNLFKSAANRIQLVVHRDNKLNATHNISNGSSRCSSAVPPYSPTINLLSPTINCDQPHRGPSPLPAYGAYEAALESPVTTLPRTEFPNLNESGGYVTPSCFSPMPTRDYQQEAAEEAASIVSQPYRTTPLILPGAKVKKDCTPTESYLRHHPNPAMRGPVHHMDDVLMKQRVADTVLHRVVGEDSRSGKVQHKQFNSPIGLYSDSNIENTIRQTVPGQSGSTPTHTENNLPSKINGYKKTVVFDPSKSETYRALQEDQYGYGDRVQEIPVPVQTRVYQPAVNRLIAGKKPQSSYPPPQPQQYHNVNSMGDSNDTIHQSHSFKRLMYSVMGETDY